MTGLINYSNLKLKGNGLDVGNGYLFSSNPCALAPCVWYLLPVVIKSLVFSILAD